MSGVHQRAYVQTADGREKIIDLPEQNGACLADTTGSYAYGNSRIIKYVHSSCKEFPRLAKRLSNKVGAA